MRVSGARTTIGAMTERRHRGDEGRAGAGPSRSASGGQGTIPASIAGRRKHGRADTGRVGTGVSAWRPPPRRGASRPPPACAAPPRGDGGKRGLERRVLPDAHDGIGLASSGNSHLVGPGGVQSAARPGQNLPGAALARKAPGNAATGGHRRCGMQLQH